MTYHDIITMKDGRECVLRSATEADGQASLDNFLLTHAQSDYLCSYPDQNQTTVEEETRMLKEKLESPNEAEILAEVDGRVAGSASVERAAPQEKARHRAEFGVTVAEEYYGLGLGRALTRACIACAKVAGYTQLELSVVSENQKAINLYLSEGFTEFGRNPRGMWSRKTGWQELILMRLELD